MSGTRRAGGVGTQRNDIKMRRYVRTQSAVENGVRTPGTQGTEKRRRMPPDVALAPQTQDKFLLMSEEPSGPEVIVEGQIGTLQDRRSTKRILGMSVCRSLPSPAIQ